MCVCVCVCKGVEVKENLDTGCGIGTAVMYF